jgi:hypothetical protein
VTPVLQVSDTRKLFLVLAGALAVAFMVQALTASPASAGLIPNPIDAVKGLIGVPGDVAGELGATVLKEALEWLLGGIEAAITIALVKFLTHIDLPVGESLAQVTGPMIVIGGFWLVVGLITSIGDGYREIVAGTDTPPRVIGQAIFRVIGLALLLGSWYWIVPLAVDVANGMSSYVLSDNAVASALRRTFAAEELLSVGFPLLGLLTAIALATAILILVVLKFVLAIAFACLYVGGPAFIGFAALPRVGGLPLAIATRGLFTLTLIPLLWTIVFVAWAGVSAAMFDTATGEANGLMGALMGPGLFLAGLVVMLATTKKALSMATFGLRLSAPGAGVVRLAVRSGVGMGVARALGATAAAGASAQASGDEAPRLSKGPATGHENQRSGDASGQPPRRPAPAQGSGFRKLPVSPPQEERFTPTQAERFDRELDVNAIASVRSGVWERRTAPTDAARVMRRQIEERRITAPPPSTAELSGLMTDLPVADRSAFAASARRAIEAHPTDPEKAWSEFRRAGVNQYAGRDLDPQQQEAVQTVLAASPESVWTSFRPDYERYRNRDLASSAHDDSRSQYDQRLMDRRGGLEAFRREAQQRPAEAGPDDLPF